MRAQAPLVEVTDYSISLEGVPGDAMRKALRDAAGLTQGRAFSPRALVRQARDDRRTLERILDAFAFYAGRVSITVADAPADSPRAFSAALRSARAGRVPVVISIEQGPRFTLQPIVIEAEPPGSLPEESETAMRGGIGQEAAAGDPATAERILAAESRLIRALEGRGHFGAQVLARDVVADHAAQTVTVMFKIAPGPVARFGPITITGLEKNKEAYVRELIDLELGQLDDPAGIDAVYGTLGATALFARIDVTLPEKTDAQGRLPLRIKVQEAEPRTIGFGARFETSEGVGLTADWMHRNILGRGETLEVDADISRFGENTLANLDYQLAVRFEKPRFRRPEQRLLTEVDVFRRDTDAFDSLGTRLNASVARDITENLTLSLGLETSFSRITDDDGEDSFFLIGIPAAAQYDNTDERLNPTQGWRASATVTPFPAITGSTDSFGKIDLRASTYIDSATLTGGSAGRVVLALRGRLGSIPAGDIDDVPADRRFFAGGGGSVRGYDFQSLSPRDPNTGRIQGGRSVIEFSGEVRWRIGENWGVVPFIDAGNAYDAIMPDFDRNVRVAGGIGARYYTQIGPLRLDIARAINPGPLSPGIGVFLSIGQSF